MSGPALFRQRRKKFQRAIPLALEFLHRELASEDCQGFDDRAAGVALAAVKGRLAQGSYPDAAIAELARFLPLDTMTDQALVDWLVEDMRPGFRVLFAPVRPS